MRMKIRFAIGGVLVSAAIAAAFGAIACGSGGATSRPLVWSDCGNDFDCAKLDVPMDYAHPGGKKITLALTRLAAADPSKRIGVLVLNRGGPGDSGISFAHSAAVAFPADVRARFDLIGWDPRGVGQSAPVVCDTATVRPTVEATVTPARRALPAPFLTELADYGRRCERGTGEALRFVDTVSSAKDIEQIRLALGESTISYFGYSYGTFLGATYADLYPSRVRAFVLDGAIDPSLDYKARIEAQATAGETALRSFLSDCASRPDCPYYNGGNPQSHFDGLVATLNTEPLVVTATSGAVSKIRGDTMEVAARLALYSSAGWKPLAQALADAEFHHDGKGLANLRSGGRAPGSRTLRNFADAANAINCLDIPGPNINDEDPFWDRLDTEAPHFGSLLAYGPIDCIGWPYPATGTPHEIHAEGAAPILVVGTKGDPVTPYAWAQSLARQLSSGHLLTFSGYGHTAAFHSPILSRCIDDAVTAYLIDLTIPDDRTACS